MLYCAQKATSKVDQCGLGCNVNIFGNFIWNHITHGGCDDGYLQELNDEEPLNTAPQ